MCFVYRFSHTRDECDTHDECVGLVLRVYSLGLGVLNHYIRFNEVCAFRFRVCGSEFWVSLVRVCKGLYF